MVFKLRVDLYIVTLSLGEQREILIGQAGSSLKSDIVCNTARVGI